MIVLVSYVFTLCSWCHPKPDLPHSFNISSLPSPGSRVAWDETNLWAHVSFAITDKSGHAPIEKDFHPICFWPGQSQLFILERFDTMTTLTSPDQFANFSSAQSYVTRFEPPIRFGLSNCVQRYLGVCPLSTPYGNKKWTGFEYDNPWIWIQK